MKVRLQPTIYPKTTITIKNNSYNNNNNSNNTHKTTSTKANNTQTKHNSNDDQKTAVKLNHPASHSARRALVARKSRSYRSSDPCESGHTPLPVTAGPKTGTSKSSGS